MTTNKCVWTSVLSAVLSLTALPPCSAAEAGAGDGNAQQALVVPYKTHLFSLLMNEKSPVDGKNHYRKEFDLAFDSMLAQSALAKTVQPKISMKQRLMSGPQPEAAIVQDKRSGRAYIYYLACQAHDCDRTNLAVLYAPCASLTRTSAR